MHAATIRQRRLSRTAQQRLQNYSRTAGAVLALGGAAALAHPQAGEAAIVYTDVVPDTDIQASTTSTPSTGIRVGAASARVHFNGSASFLLGQYFMKLGAFSFSTSVPTSQGNTSIPFTMSLFVQRQAAALQGAAIGQSGYLDALDAGATIGSGANFITGTITGTNFLGENQCAGFNLHANGAGKINTTLFGTVTTSDTQAITLSASQAGNFCGAGDKYLGVRFDLSGDTHYGWIRVNVAADCSRITIKDYAYEDAPDTPIKAGDGIPTVGGVVHDVSDDSPDITPLEED